MTSQLKKIISTHNFILMEGAVVEVLRRSEKVELHPNLINAHLIYDSKGLEALTSIYNSYLKIAKNNDLPYVMCAPTWRANKENVKKSGIKESVNIDAVHYMKKIQNDAGDFGEKILIGGIIGPKNDCYTPELGLSKKEAEEFHTWQIAELAKSGVDFIIAETVPNVQEALGMAAAASNQKIDYIISFVISRDGKILDNTSLDDAIKLIDKSTNNIPVGYAVNCAHPSFLCAYQQPKEIFKRLIAFMGNASSLDHCDLENSDCLQVDNVSGWGDEMLKLNHEFGIKILGGCCGTGQKHLEYLVSGKNQ